MVQLTTNFTDVSFETLRALIPWEQRSVTVYGKIYPQPRLTKWYGLVPYAYSGVTWPPCEMPAELEQLRSRLQERLGVPFNSVLANLYRDGSDAVGWHADDEAIFGGDPEIASLSFGATRTFKLRLNADTKVQQSFELEHGSLLFMGKGVQPAWQHSLPRTKKPVGERINLTFRVTTA